MKKQISSTLGILILSAMQLRGQGTFIYDQQSADENSPDVGLAKLIQPDEPIGQSFVPTLSSVGFIRLFMSDLNPDNGQGATVYLNLLSGSMTGTVIAMTEPLTFPDNYGDGPNAPVYPTFYFSSPVPVDPGTTYYMQAVVQSGDLWQMKGSDAYDYTSGTAFLGGDPSPDANFDFWFREGIVIPEPSTLALLLLSGGALAAQRRRC